MHLLTSKNPGSRQDAWTRLYSTRRVCPAGHYKIWDSGTSLYTRLYSHSSYQHQFHTTDRQHTPCGPSSSSCASLSQLRPWPQPLAVRTSAVLSSSVSISLYCILYCIQCWCSCCVHDGACFAWTAWGRKQLRNDGALLYAEVGTRNRITALML